MNPLAYFILLVVFVSLVLPLSYPHQHNQPKALYFNRTMLRGLNQLTQLSQQLPQQKQFQQFQQQLFQLQNLQNNQNQRHSYNSYQFKENKNNSKIPSNRISYNNSLFHTSFHFKTPLHQPPNIVVPLPQTRSFKQTIHQSHHLIQPSIHPGYFNHQLQPPHISKQPLHKLSILNKPHYQSFHLNQPLHQYSYFNKTHLESSRFNQSHQRPKRSAATSTIHSGTHTLQGPHNISVVLHNNATLTCSLMRMQPSDSVQWSITDFHMGPGSDHKDKEGFSQLKDGTYPNYRVYENKSTGWLRWGVWWAERYIRKAWVKCSRRLKG